MTNANSLKVNNTVYEFKDLAAVNTLQFADGALSVTKGNGTVETVAFPKFVDVSIEGETLVFSEVTDD